MKRSAKHAALAASLSLCLAAPAWAQDDRNPEEWLRLAGDGNVQANMTVCGGYLGGVNGFPKDQPKSFPFCKTYADDTGNPVFQTVVARLYRQGLGVAKDDVKAAKYGWPQSREMHRRRPTTST